MRKCVLHRQAQTSLEFSFSVIIACLLLLGMVRIMLWTGKDLIARRHTHEAVLTGSGTPATQVRPKFYLSTSLNAAKPSNIFDETY